MNMNYTEEDGTAENATEDQVTITIGEESYNIDPDLLRQYAIEAYEILKREAEAKADFKGAVETMEETFGIPKTVLSKWLKARYKAETKKASELAEAFEQLDAGVA